MKTLIFYISIFLLFYLSTACNKNRVNSVKKDSPSESAFNPILTRELVKFIECFKGRDKITNLKYPFHVQFYKRQDGECYALIVCDFFYDEKQIIGYTYINEELVAYYKSDDIVGVCSDSFVFPEHFQIMIDTIPDYLSIKNELNKDVYIDAPFREFKIINKDSLLLVAKRGICTQTKL